MENLEKYLLNRGIEIIKRDKPLEITESEELLVDVAGAWKSNQEAIRAVIQARCDKIRTKILMTDMPVEVPVSRQCLVELAGILQDFENISTEFGKREKNKGGTEVVETTGKKE